MTATRPLMMDALTANLNVITLAQLVEKDIVKSVSLVGI